MKDHADTADSDEVSGGLDFQALFESAPGLYLVLTPDFRIVAASNAYLHATMTTREQIFGRYIFDVFPDNPADPEANGVRNLRASLLRVLQHRAPDAMPIQKYDVRRRESDGGEFEQRYWSPLNAPVFGPQGEIRYIIHRVEDVTEFVMLKEAEQRAQALEIRAGQMEAEIYRRAQEVAGTNRQLRAANDELNALYRRIAALIHQSAAGIGEPSAGSPPETPEASIPPDEMVGRIGDLITRHLEVSEQLRQAQKMEAIGQLAGGVAHDFNNLLTVITTSAEFLRERFPENETPSELVDIEQAATRAAELTTKLLAFSRRQVMQPRVIGLNRVVAGLEGLLRRLIGEDIQLVTALASGLGNVKADPTQIEQVILNLAVNARDAMPNGGRLVIETRNVELGESQEGNLKAGSYVALSVADTGHGMEEEVARRVFEPFFTTKEPGKGTGLGLATAHGIAEQNGGTLTVQTAPGQGAIFRMYLPRCPETVSEEEKPAEAAVVAGRAGCILLVEDEAPLRRLILQSLRKAGHEVIEAVRGEEALLKAQSGARLDLVLTDVVMPGMSGPEMVARLRRMRPEIAVLYMSGYDRELIRQTPLDDASGFLPKPFTPKTLLNRVAEVLRAGERRRNVAS